MMTTEEYARIRARLLLLATAARETGDLLGFIQELAAREAQADTYAALSKLVMAADQLQLVANQIKEQL